MSYTVSHFCQSKAGQSECRAERKTAVSLPLPHLQQRPPSHTHRPIATHTLTASTGAAFKGQECRQRRRRRRRLWVGVLVCGQRLWHAKRAKFKGIKIFCGWWKPHAMRVIQIFSCYREAEQVPCFWIEVTVQLGLQSDSRVPCLDSGPK